MGGASPSQIHDVLSPPADSSFKPSDADVEIQDQAPPKNQEEELPIVRQPIGLSKKKKNPKYVQLFKIVSLQFQMPKHDLLVEFVNKQVNSLGGLFPEDGQNLHCGNDS
ncbi:hypothetical protein Scep_004037 [Stephania cephalantha]|uniref:Uncharacterized protein n=1 Tax=Stephania cephalantha TaxID=152367 RepID=A0AAP0PV18_9MAGN